MIMYIFIVIFDTEVVCTPPFPLPLVVFGCF